MMNSDAIVYYHGNDWDGIQGRQQYLMREMSNYATIIYLDGGMDKKWKVTRREVEENIFVVRGLAGAFGGFDRHPMMGAGTLAAKLFARKHLGSMLGEFDRVIFWCAENWLRPYRFIKHDMLVYDCIDPSFSTDPGELERYERREAQVAQAADTVFVTADALAERCRKHYVSPQLLNNGCQPSDYSEDLVLSAARPAWWPSSGRPVVAYLGSMDWRVDYDLLEAVCRALPEYDFVLAGTRLEAFEERVKRLEAVPNVVAPGRISLEEGRYLLSRMTVGFVPYGRNEMNDCINSTKIYAHALLGKPTVATAIRELASRPEAALVGRTVEELVGVLRQGVALAGDGKYTRWLREYAQQNTWEKRAQFVAVVLQLSRVDAWEAAEGDKDVAEMSAKMPRMGAEIQMGYWTSAPVSIGRNIAPDLGNGRPLCWQFNKQWLSARHAHEKKQHV